MRALALFSAFVGAALVSAAPRQHAQTELDFDFGWAVGECLVAKCQIFRGSIAEAPLPGGATIRVRVDESIYGSQADGQTVSVPYRNSAPTNKDGVHDVADVWRNFVPSQNAPIAVVRLTERFLDIPAYNPVIVTADERKITMIRALANDAERLEDHPDAIVHLVASVSDSDPALAGYLDAYLLFRTELKQPDLTTELRIRMLGSPSLPQSRKCLSARRMAGIYGRLSSTERSAVVQALTEFMQRYLTLKNETDAPLALAAYAGLVTTWAKEPSKNGSPDPSELNALAAAYINGVRAGTFGRTQLLETELRIDPSLLRAARQKSTVGKQE